MTIQTYVFGSNAINRALFNDVIYTMSMRQLSKNQKELWKEISKILWEKWDPIGVYEKDSEWKDEYDSYVPHIFQLASEGADSYRIAGSLASSAHQNMGFELMKNREGDLRAANLIVKAKEQLLQK